MNAPVIAPMRDGDADAVATLWMACGLTRPWNDPRADIAFARKSGQAEVLVARDPAVIASVMVGHDGHRGWLYYLAVAPERRKAGLGRMMTAAAEDWLRARNVPKVMLMVRADNRAVCDFYNALGYETQERAIFAKWLDGRPMTP